jgi:hypothetical protein
MSAQLTSETLNQWLSMSSLAAVIAGVPPEVALGALAGAVIFVTSAVEYPIRRRVLLSMLSFLCGLLFYKPAASILIGIIYFLFRRFTTNIICQFSTFKFPSLMF